MSPEHALTPLALTDPVVVVTPGRPGHGQQVRWFLNVEEATRPAGARLVATARGVAVGGYLTDLPGGWVDAAVRAHRRLHADPRTDLRPMATHYNRGPANGPLVPVETVH